MILLTIFPRIRVTISNHTMHVPSIANTAPITASATAIHHQQTLMMMVLLLLLLLMLLPAHTVQCHRAARPRSPTLAQVAIAAAVRLAQRPIDTAAAAITTATTATTYLQLLGIRIVGVRMKTASD